MHPEKKVKSWQCCSVETVAFRKLNSRDFWLIITRYIEHFFRKTFIDFDVVWQNNIWLDEGMLFSETSTAA